MVHLQLNKEVEIAFFDFNGTTIDSVGEAITKTSELIKNIFGRVDHDKAKKLFKMISNGINIKDILNQLFSQESEEKRMLFAKEFEERKKNIIKEAKAFEGIREAFAKLQEQGIEIVVSTKIPEDLIWYCLKKEGLAPYVNFALGRESGTKKDHIEKILSEADMPKERAVFISDNTEDLSLIPNTLGIGENEEELRKYGATQVFATTVEAINFILEGPKQPVLFLFTTTFFSDNINIVR